VGIAGGSGDEVRGSLTNGALKGRKPEQVEAKEKRLLGICKKRV